LVNEYKLDSAPSIVIDGRYTTSPATAGHGTMTEPQSQQAMFQVMDVLLAKSLQDRAATGGGKK
jgi:thiol:disulfide interchange protein DsbA